MKRRLAVLAGFLVALFVPLLPAHFTLAGSASRSSIVISEVKLGGDSFSQGPDQPKDPQEFVSLFNQSSTDITLDGWVLEYAKPTFDKTYCSAGDWVSHSVSGSAGATTLSGSLQPGQVSLPVGRSMTDNKGGSLRLVNTTDPNHLIIEDVVGWGTDAPCFETSPTSTPGNGKSIKRYLSCDTNYPTDTDNNAADFAINQPPSPGILDSPFITTCAADSGNVQNQPSLTCEGVVVSEILPNPAGADSGHEFIELYNPTGNIISLSGCALQTTANDKVFSLDNHSLQPHEYHAFYDTETGLTLNNAAGGTVWLLSPATELQAINYQANLDDDVAWALINGAWYATYQPSPNAANVLQTSKPCPAGQERNADTGYCRDAVLSSVVDGGLAACKPGQERNPSTNRCRSVTVAGSSLTACRAGQVRNPQTNRCKAATTAASSLKPCPAGQERNPATNRCKKSVTNGKVAGASTGNSGIGGPFLTDPHWLLAGAAAIGATSYGVYEWRQELLNWFAKFKNKLPLVGAK